MHLSAMFYGRKFFETYCRFAPPANLTVVDIGSQDVNGSLRDAAPAGVKYVGLDFVKGRGVDIVLSDPYVLPLPDASVDVVVSSSCFEHSEFFWLVFLEAIRVLKPEGLFYLNAPSNGYFHRYPVDCWRFYPDSGHALAAWGQRNKFNCMLLESFIGQAQRDVFNDFVAVFLKDAQHKTKYPDRILHGLNGVFLNGHSSDREEILNFTSQVADLNLLATQTRRIDELTNEIKLLRTNRGT